MDRVLVFRLGRRALDFLLDGHLRFTRDGEGGATCYRRLGVLRVVTVRGGKVNGQATIVAEALEAAVAFLFLLSELAIRSNAWVGATGHGCIGRCGWVAAQFCWHGGRGSLPVLTRGCGLLALAFPVMSVALQGGDLELLEHLGSVQRQELVFDALSKSLIELTI